MKEKLNKEHKIIAFIGIYGSLILALTSENKIFSIVIILKAFIYLCWYTYLVFKK